MTAPISSRSPEAPSALTKKRLLQNKQKYQQLTAAPKTALDLRTAFQGIALPDIILRLIAEYAETPSPLPANPFVARVNLLDTAVLRPLLSHPYQTDRYLLSARTILKKTFEVDSELTQDEDFDYRIYPLCAEIYVYAMRFLKTGNTMLELGAARGYFSLLAGFSEAQTIYVNDSNTKELDLFQTELGKLPQDIREKFVSLPGDCLAISTYRSLLNVDFVMCRNLIHFFTPLQMEQFFKNLHRVTQSGTQAIFTVNTHLSVINGRRPNTDIDPEASCIDRHICSIVDHEKIIGTLFESTVTSSEQIFSRKVTRALLLAKFPQEGWRQDFVACGKLSPELRLLVKKTTTQHKAAIERMPSAREIFLTSTQSQFFTKKSLTSLLAGHGFKVNALFYTDETGHIITNESSPKLLELGALCTKL